MRTILPAISRTGVHLNTGSHPWTIGTGLKTEIYGHITDRGGIDDANVENTANWRIYQQKKGETKFIGIPVPGEYWSTWTDEVGSPFTHCIVNTTYDLSDDYLYHEDCPRITGASGGGADGTNYTLDTEYQTWISFKSGVTWHRVTPKEKWGMEAKIEIVSGSWSVVEEATAKSY